MKAFKTFIKAFEAPKRSVKIKISANFSSSRIGMRRVKVFCKVMENMEIKEKQK